MKMEMEGTELSRLSGKPGGALSRRLTTRRGDFLAGHVEELTQRVTVLGAANSPVMRTCGTFFRL